MQVKDEDISTLIELQHNDMELLRVQKAIADLPQRKTIVAARKKIKAIEEKQETVGKLRAKAEEKLAGISEEDSKLAEFQSQGGELKKQEADLAASHDQIAANLPADLKARYDRAAKHCGGVAVALLRDDACGACRAPIEQGHLIDLKAHAPLGECPNCKRLLIVLPS